MSINLSVKMLARTTVLSSLLCLGLPVHAAEPARPASASQPKAVAQSPVPAKATAPVTGRINVNTADITTLSHLKGVGEKKAQAIVAYRKQNGPFNSLEQFGAVPGIGPSILAQNKSVIVFR